MCLAIYGRGHIWQEVISLVSVHSGALHPGSLRLSVYMQTTISMLITWVCLLCLKAFFGNLFLSVLYICCDVDQHFWFFWYLYLLILDLHYANNDVWERLLMLCKLDWGQFISCCGVLNVFRMMISAYLINGPQVAKVSNVHSEMLSQKNSSADEDHVVLLTMCYCYWTSNKHSRLLMFLKDALHFMF